MKDTITRGRRAQEGDAKDIKNYRPISLLSHTYKIFTRLLQLRIERKLDENQPREQAGFRKGFSTVDHIHTLNQLIEKTDEHNIPLVIGFIDYEKAFDSIEHFAIIDALRQIGVNEGYVKIIKDMYTNATASINIEEMTSKPFKINRGVRQGDPISPKLFTTAIHEILRKSQFGTTGIPIDGEILTDLRFADDIALLAKNTDELNAQLNEINQEGNKVGMKIHRGKTKYMTNNENANNATIAGEEIEKVTHYKYLGQTMYMKEATNAKIDERIRAGWNSFGKHKEILQNKEIPTNLKKRVFDQCILPTLTYGCQTWKINKGTIRKIRTAQRKMERKMLNIKQTDRIKNSDIRKKTKVIDIVKYVTKAKASWAGHVARLQDNRWTRRTTEWTPRQGKRARGRPPGRWRDDLEQHFGKTWTRTAQERAKWKRQTEGYIRHWMDIA